jgi:hypothetical protein
MDCSRPDRHATVTAPSGIRPKTRSGLVRACEQCVDGERASGSESVSRSMAAVCPRPASPAGRCGPQGAQQGVRGDSGAVGSFGFLLLAALFVLHLLLEFVFGGELVLTAASAAGSTPPLVANSCAMRSTQRLGPGRVRRWPGPRGRGRCAAAAGRRARPRPRWRSCRWRTGGPRGGRPSPGRPAGGARPGLASRRAGGGAHGASQLSRERLLNSCRAGCTAAVEQVYSSREFRGLKRDFEVFHVLEIWAQAHAGGAALSQIGLGNGLSEQWLQLIVRRAVLLRVQDPGGRARARRRS